MRDEWARGGAAEGSEPAEGVALRPVDVAHDSEALRTIMAGSWHVPRFNSAAAFTAWLRERLEREWLEFAVVAPAGSPERVAGYALAWDYRPVDGHVHVDVRVGDAHADGRACDFAQEGGLVEHGLLGAAARMTARDSSAMSSGPGMPARESLLAQAAGAFVSRLFREYPLRKVFVEKVADGVALTDGASASGQPAAAGRRAAAGQPAASARRVLVGRTAAAGQSASRVKATPAGDSIAAAQFRGVLPLRYEMTLKDYTFRRGAYRDLDVWSLSREAWEKWVRG